MDIHSSTREASGSDLGVETRPEPEAALMCTDRVRRTFPKPRTRTLVRYNSHYTCPHRQTVKPLVSTCGKTGLCGLGQGWDNLAAMLTIQGATLAGMAAAARLARLGHQVQLSLEGTPQGGRWAPLPGPAGLAVDAAPPVIVLPALWRDLFKKTGRPLAGSTGAVGLELSPTAGTTHRFNDGSSFTLPTERGQQFYAIQDRYGTSAAERWRDLLDGLDEVWAARRRFGVESPTSPTTRQDRDALWLGHTLTDLAERLAQPHLAAIVRSLGHRNGTDSPDAPALLAVDLVLERTFDRWQLRYTDGTCAPASALVELLARRLTERGVDLIERADAPDLVCLPELPSRGWLRRSPRPAQAPTIRHELVDGPAPTGVEETVDHTGEAPVVTWRRPTSEGIIVTIHDHRDTSADLSAGLAPDNAKAWLRRVALDAPLPAASVCSPAGNAMWSELAVGALAAYLIHEQRTGVDPSPRNKAFTLPPLRR